MITIIVFFMAVLSYYSLAYRYNDIEFLKQVYLKEIPDEIIARREYNINENEVTILKCVLVYFLFVAIALSYDIFYTVYPLVSMFADKGASVICATFAGIFGWACIYKYYFCAENVLKVISVMMVTLPVIDILRVFMAHFAQ